MLIREKRRAMSAQIGRLDNQRRPEPEKFGMPYGVRTGQQPSHLDIDRSRRRSLQRFRKDRSRERSRRALPGISAETFSKAPLRAQPERQRLTQSKRFARG